jgi:hypothetical protein
VGAEAEVLARHPILHTKSDVVAQGTNDISINVVLPARTTDKRYGFCDVLMARVRCTLPQAFAEVEGMPDGELFTREAADRHQAAAGRYMVKWEGAHHHYQHTPFGRMEYWLDRDECPAKRIDEASNQARQLCTATEHGCAQSELATDVI